MFVSLIWQNGGDYRDEANSVVHFNTPRGQKAAEFMLKNANPADPDVICDIGASRYELFIQGTAPWSWAPLVRWEPRDRRAGHELPVLQHARHGRGQRSVLHGHRRLGLHRLGREQEQARRLGVRQADDHP